MFKTGDSTKFCNFCFMAFDKDKSGFIGSFKIVYHVIIHYLKAGISKIFVSLLLQWEYFPKAM